jgi:hypothetical protein
MGGMDDLGGKRGFLKPENRLQWKAGAAPPPVPKARAKASSPQSPRPKGLPSNAVTQSQFTMDQLQKMAVSRGLSMEKLLAQMVQQYLKEE